MITPRPIKHSSGPIIQYSASSQREPVILHVDMDAFFASVEQKERPWLAGKPVIVGGDPKKRCGVVSAASYAAREYGIRAGMSLFAARRLCPQAVFLIGIHGDKYEYVSSRLVKIFRQFTPQVEPYSIDEAFLDITGCERLFGPPLALGKKLKEKVREELGLSCSVGIAPSKLLAKLASSLNKPDGLTVIPREKIKETLDPLEVSDLCGIGHKTAKVLSSLGIHTAGELASYPVGVLKEKFGIVGEWLHLMANGIDCSPVIPGSVPDKSMGHSRTLPQDIDDPQQIGSILLWLSSLVARRLRQGGFKGRTITLRMRYSDFFSLTRSETIPRPTDSEHVIFKVALKLALGLVSGIRKVRLLGVSVSQLKREEESLQIPLPLVEYRDKREEVYWAMDQIRDKFGEESVRWGGAAVLG